MTIDYTPINPVFDGLPRLVCPPCPMTDSDVEFHSDITYLRDLLIELREQADRIGRARDIPPPWSDQLQAATTELKVIKARIREFRRG